MRPRRKWLQGRFAEGLQGQLTIQALGSQAVSAESETPCTACPPQATPT